VAGAGFEAACKLNEAGATLMPAPVLVAVPTAVPDPATETVLGAEAPVLLLPPPQAVTRVTKAKANAPRLSRRTPKADVLVAKSRLTCEPTLERKLRSRQMDFSAHLHNTYKVLHPLRTRFLHAFKSRSSTQAPPPHCSADPENRLPHSRCGASAQTAFRATATCRRRGWE
jgi:hypothetical protein